MATILANLMVTLANLMITLANLMVIIASMSGNNLNYFLIAIDGNFRLLKNACKILVQLIRTIVIPAIGTISL